MKHLYIHSLILAFALMMWACSDDDTFSASPSRLLSFSSDTISLDTVFSNVSSATRSFWVYNRSGEGLRCSSVRLSSGASSGFRVNVDGQYLGSDVGYQISDLEIRDNDSIRVYVEATTHTTNSAEPKKVEDELVFTLESGVEQKVNLNAYSWDALLLHDLKISSDTTLAQDSIPIVIYGGITVDSAATLTVADGTTLYFHQDAGIDVYGTLLCQGTAENGIVLRGDRIDRMFDYLPYDRTPGQWQGVRLHASSFDNVLTYTDIHSSYNGIVADSSSLSRDKLTLSACTIHNCQGWGLWAQNSKINVENTQVTNTLNDCVHFEGGNIVMNGCTLAQFYPFDANRGVSLYIGDGSPLVEFSMSNSLVTGYADDVLKGTHEDSTVAFNYDFSYSVLRTPKVTTSDSIYYNNIVFEDSEDTISSGTKHFLKIDTDNLIYDFSLDSISSAIGKANPSSAPATDRWGRERDSQPDAGAYEYIKQN